MQKFTEWLENDTVDCGMCDPPMEAQKAIDFLTDYLLGKDWYVTMPENTQQVNTAIVFEILLEYSKEFRKEWKKYTKARK
jgi:hypothetical protein